MFFFDPLYFLMLGPVMLIAGIAQWRVKRAYAAAQKEPASITGAAAARMVLDDSGLTQVDVEITQGFLSDHYDPRAKVIRLSPEVYQSRTLAAVGIAAHEAGHAIQDAKNYSPLVIRNAVVPLASTGGGISMFVFIAGLFLGGAATVVGQWLLFAGIGLFATMVFFQLVNLPVEFDASRRAKLVLADLQVVQGDQAAVVNNVLSAAAMTYVAATVSTIMTLAYMLIRSGLLGGDD